MDKFDLTTIALNTAAQAFKNALIDYYTQYCTRYAESLNEQKVYAPYIRSKRESFTIESVRFDLKKGWVAYGSFPKCKKREIRCNDLYCLEEGEYKDPAPKHLEYRGPVCLEQIYSWLH